MFVNKWTISYLGMFSGEGMTFLAFNMHDNRSLVGSRRTDIVLLAKSFECSSDTVKQDAGSIITCEKNVCRGMSKRKSDELVNNYCVALINDP